MATGALTVKEIKPERLKDDAMRQALLNAIRKQGTAIKAEFAKTTASWERKVKFTTEVSLALDGPAAFVFTNDEIYGYVNNGTKPHPIFAGIYTGKSTKKALSFQWGGKGSYRAKTRPRVIGSTPGGPTGPRIARPYVDHPGSAGRHFDEVIEKDQTPKFKRRMEKAMRDAAKASGHGK